MVILSHDFIVTRLHKEARQARTLSYLAEHSQKRVKKEVNGQMEAPPASQKVVRLLYTCPPHQHEKTPTSTWS